MNRRHFLVHAGQGFGALALSALLAGEDRAASARAATGGVLAAPHHPPRAKRVVQLFMAGAASHIDLWDHKPALEKRHGEVSDFGERVEAFQDGLGPWM